MLVLAVDTSTPACSAGVVELLPPVGGDGVGAAPWDRVTGAWSRSVVDARRHGELLAPLIDEVLRAWGTRPAALDAVAVGLGPGPFTSLRVGIVTAATFAAALGVPCHGVCSLDGIGAATAGRAGVVTDARRREVFWAAYEDGARIAGPAVGPPARAAELLSGAGADTVTGPGVALYPDAFAGFRPATASRRQLGTGAVTGGHAHPHAGDLDPGPDGVTRVVPHYPSPTGLAVLAAPALFAGQAPEPLLPIYLRRPDVAEPHPAKAVTA